MSRQIQERTFDEAVQWLRDHGFDILEAPGTKKRDFIKELKEATGMSSLYYESLGTVSDSYHYDRVEDRDEAVIDRPKRPWKEAPAPAAATKPAGKKRA